MLIADRTNDPVVAETAVKQLETAYETMRSGGQEVYFAEQLAKAVIRRRCLTPNRRPNACRSTSASHGWRSTNAGQSCLRC
jgi:hypothetical protein